MSCAIKKYSKEDLEMRGYESLLDYYRDCFSLVDYFHFNSEVSKTVYSERMQNINGKVVPITHYGIKDNRRKKKFKTEKLRMGFIGSAEPFKGLPLLIDVLGKIGMEDNWELSVWGGKVGKHPSLPIYYKGKYSVHTIDNVYDAMDVLIVPSVWKETFSLVTLEALSYGVPVIVSDNVGAQDIVRQYDERFIFHDKNDLEVLLRKILSDNSLLHEYNKRICKLSWSHDMMSHAKEIIINLF